MSALPQTATVTELHPEPDFSLRQVVRECAGELEAPNRDALINAVIERVHELDAGEAALYQLLRKCLSAFIGEGRQAEARRRLGSTDSRWGDVANHHGSGALAIYRWWITLDPGQPAKFFGDCTHAEVEQAAALYKTRAVEMADQAQRFAAVAKTMKERNAETVQDVPVERLVEIFNA